MVYLKREMTRARWIAEQIAPLIHDPSSLITFATRYAINKQNKLFIHAKGRNKKRGTADFALFIFLAMGHLISFASEVMNC